MAPPTFDNRINPTTILVVAQLALMLIGGGIAYQSLRAQIDAGRVEAARLSSDITSVRADQMSQEPRIRALELGAGRTDEKLTNILAVLARIERQLDERPTP